MSDGAVVDTGFLISLVDRNRPGHDAAKQYYRYFLENGVTISRSLPKQSSRMQGCF